MLKILGLFTAGLAAGIAIVALMLDVDPGEQGSASPLPLSSAAADEQLETLSIDIEQWFTMLDERFATFDQRLSVLADQVAKVRAAALSGRGAAQPIPTPEDIARLAAERARQMEDVMEARRAGAEQRERDQLLAAGFTPERIDWIKTRIEELQGEANQAQYEALQAGRPAGPDVMLSILDPEALLRSEMSDDEYERYVAALGRPTNVDVDQVLASSPAKQAGLQAGDELVAYGGKRVLSYPELTALTLDGTPGEPVVVDVRRDGQMLQLVLPRGPLGISSTSTVELARRRALH